MLAASKRLLSREFHWLFSRSLRIESFFDYTFYQSFFNAEKAIIPRFEEDQSLLLEPYHRSSLSLTPFCRNSNQELVFEIFPGKTGTFQDLPAKAVYSTVNQQDSDEEAITSQICWSTAHGKVEIHESAPLNSFGQKEIEGMSCDCRWALFLGVSGLNMAVPALNYRRLRRSLPPTRSRQ